MNFRKNDRVEWKRKQLRIQRIKFKYRQGATRGRGEKNEGDANAVFALVQGTVSLGRIDSSRWNGIVIPVGVSDVPTIEQTCIQRVRGLETE